MNYKNKRVAITGSNGFIGYALTEALTDAGAYLDVIDGDVRNPETFNCLTYEHDYLFHFADPSSQILFKRQPLYAAEVTLTGFIHAATACRKNGIKLIYPSTGLLSQSKENEYARCKKVCEEIHLGEGLDALGIRIFATYGPGEGHKRDYASVPYLFARDMYNGKAPVVWGDGSQARDLIYIDDTVEGILTLAETANEPIIDLGNGYSVTFAEVLDELKSAFKLRSNKKIPDPVYIDRPAGYVDDTCADTTIMSKYFQTKVGLVKGIDQTAASIIMEAKKPEVILI